MVTQTILCPHCGSDRLIRFGKAPSGKQKYRCHGCGRCSRDSPGSAAHDAALRERVLGRLP